MTEQATSSDSKATLGDMKVGQVAYTLPWSMCIDTDGEYLLQATYSALAQPKHHATMAVELRKDGYHVWAPKGEDFGPPHERHEFDAAPSVFLDVVKLYWGSRY